MRVETDIDIETPEERIEEALNEGYWWTVTIICIYRCLIKCMKCSPDS